MEINQIAVGEIKPYEKNAKKHTKKQVEQISESIKNFGFNQPIVVDLNNVIIVGHGRFEAAKQLGFKEVPVLKVSLTEEQARSYRLGDNRLNESDWDMDLVIEELKMLPGEMRELTGFDIKLLDPEFAPSDDGTRLDVGKKWFYKCQNCQALHPFSRKDLIPADEN